MKCSGSNPDLRLNVLLNSREINFFLIFSINLFSCTDLVLEDDIGPSMNCAKIVYKVQGFKAWNGWIKKCKGKKLPPLVC